jgi:hypothetical protein
LEGHCSLLLAKGAKAGEGRQSRESKERRAKVGRRSPLGERAFAFPLANIFSELSVDALFSAFEALQNE